MLDASGFSEAPPLEEYAILLNELESFEPELLHKPRAVALTKMDGVSDWDEVARMERELREQGETVFRISSMDGSGLRELQDHLALTVRTVRNSSDEATGDEDAS